MHSIKTESDLKLPHALSGAHPTRFDWALAPRLWGKQSRSGQARVSCHGVIISVSPCFLCIVRIRFELGSARITKLATFGSIPVTMQFSRL